MLENWLRRLQCHVLSDLTWRFFPLKVSGKAGLSAIPEIQCAIRFIAPLVCEEFVAHTNASQNYGLTITMT